VKQATEAVVGIVFASITEALARGDDVTGERRHAALYGPGGPLEPSYRLEWLCWGTFGTADGC